MPYDALSLVTLAAVAGLLLAASRGRTPIGMRIACIVVAALLLRADAAYQRSLHVWDESFHALVARNLIDTPLRPVLYRAPALPYDPQDWMSNHVWLHKPPAALWLMAGSMALFGIGELALRVPSVLLSTGSVLLTFLIGRQLLSTRMALLAAAFHAVNGFLIALAAGRRVADHVDTALIFFVELAVWLAIGVARDRRSWWLVLAGVATGAGFLSKTWPALVVLPVVWIYLAGMIGWRRASQCCALIGAVAAAVAAPWVLFIWQRYPAEAAGEALYTFRHMSSVVEEQRTVWWTYIADLPRFFGELTPLGLAIGASAAFGAGARRELRVLLVWIALPYLVFSVFATRMPGYVMIAAPAIFLLLAAGLDRAYQWLPPRGGRRTAALVVLGITVLLTGRHLLEPRGPLANRDRSPVFARQLERLDDRLGLPDAVLFNVPRPIDAMFYSGYTAYERMPTEAEVRDIVASGRPVVIYQPAGGAASVPSGWPVIELPEVGR